MKIRTITLVEGDKLIDLQFVAKDLDGIVIDLTDASIKLKAQAYDFKKSIALASELAWDISGSISDGPNGKFEVQIPEVDLDPDYSYLAEIEATYGGGKVVTAPLVRIEVIRQLPI